MGKMMTNFIGGASLVVLTAVQVQASHVERCELRARVDGLRDLAVLNENHASVPGRTNTYARAVVFTVLSATKLEGSYVDCQARVGEQQQLLLKGADVEKLGALSGKEITLLYRYLDGRAPGGVSKSESWTLK